AGKIAQHSRMVVGGIPENPENVFPSHAGAQPPRWMQKVPRQHIGLGARLVLCEKAVAVSVAEKRIVPEGVVVAVRHDGLCMFGKDETRIQQLPDRSEEHTSELQSREKLV